MPISPKPAFELKIQCRMLGPVRDVAAQVGVEHDVRGACAGELALERQPDLLGDPRPGAVEAQQVAGPLGERRARSARRASRTVTPSASCSWSRYSVLKLTIAPRSAAFLISSGSISGCGMSSIVHGLPCR